MVAPYDPYPPPVTDEIAGLPLDAYAAYPPPVAPPTDIVPPDAAPQPLDTYAELPPPPLTGNPWVAQPEPAPPPVPDAVTGGLVPMQTAQPAPLPPEYIPPPFDPTARDPFAQYTPAEAFKVAEQLPPEVRLQTEMLQASRKAIEQEAALHQAAVDNLKQIKQNAEDRKKADALTQAKEDQIMADSQALAAQGIDRSRWFKHASTGQTLAAVGGALIGGLMSKPGQPNQGIQFVANLVDKDIEDQKYDIENKRADLNFRQGAVAREFARTGDLNRAAETVREATYQAMIGEIKTRQQDFDVNGTMYLKYGDARAQATAMADQNRIARADKERDQQLKVIEQDRKNRETAAKIANERATIGLGYARINEDKAQRLAAKQAKLDEKAQERADKEDERIRKFSMSSPRSVVVTDDKGAPVIGTDGKPQTTGTQFLNKDGKPWTIEDVEDRRAVKNKLVAASEIDDIVNEVKDIREHIGKGVMPWSAAKQRLGVLKHKAGNITKAGTQGMSSDKDFERIEGMIAADSFDSFVDRSEALDEVQARNRSTLNAEMRAAGYTGPPVSFDNRWVRAKNTPEDDRRQALLRNPNQSLDEAIKTNLDRVASDRGYGIDINDPADQKLYQSVVQSTQRTFSSGATGEQAKQIAEEGRKAAAGDATALAILKEVFANGESGDLRRLAKEQLDSLAPKPTPRGPVSEPVAVPDELRLP